LTRATILTELKIWNLFLVFAEAAWPVLRAGNEGISCTISVIRPLNIHFHIGTLYAQILALRGMETSVNASASPAALMILVMLSISCGF
jgi:hypothetical protein